MYPNYVMHLYNTPEPGKRKYVGYRNIPKDQFDFLQDDCFIHIELGRDRWEIKDRRWFWHETLIHVTGFIIIDAMVIGKATTT